MTRKRKTLEAAPTANPDIGYQHVSDWINDPEMAAQRAQTQRWRAEVEHVNAWREAVLRSPQHPFRFEDLNGKCEPESWGPTYPKTASQAVEKWRSIARGRELTVDEAQAYGAAVHAWIRALNNPGQRRHAVPESDLHYRYSGAHHCAQLRAAFHAKAAADRREWAMSQAIAEAYAACPKRGDRKPPKPCKPHYLLRNGEWRLAA